MLGLIQVAVHDFGDLLLGNRADDLVGHLAALKDQKCRNAADIVAACRIDILIHVELDDFQLPGVFVGDFSHSGREHVTRTAPIRPEVHHYRLRVAGLDHFGLEACVRNAGDGICHFFPFAARFP